LLELLVRKAVAAGDDEAEKSPYAAIDEDSYDSMRDGWERYGHTPVIADAAHALEVDDLVEAFESVGYDLRPAALTVDDEDFTAVLTSQGGLAYVYIALRHALSRIRTILLRQADDLRARQRHRGRQPVHVARRAPSQKRCRSPANGGNGGGRHGPAGAFRSARAARSRSRAGHCERAPPPAVTTRLSPYV
jgi:hypothetical protein